MDENEEYVRAMWENAKLDDHTECCGCLGCVDEDGLYRVITETRYFPWAKTPATAWSAAREYTDTRKEEIRQLRRQIEWCQAGLSDWFYPIYWHWNEDEQEEESVIRIRASNARDDVTGRLVVARLESALAELCRGWKGEA